MIEAIRWAPMAAGNTTRLAPAWSSFFSVRWEFAAGHDLQIAIEIATCQGDEHVGGVAGQRRDQRLGTLDAGGAQHLFLGGVAERTR